MTLISDLIPVVDQARKMIEQTGFRIHKVEFIHITWPLKRGIGTPTITRTLLNPQPKILKYTLEQIIQSGGALIAGDLEISKISKTYTLVQLMGSELPDTQEFFWAINDELYSSIGYQERPIGWNIQVRKTNRKLV